MLAFAGAMCAQGADTVPKPGEPPPVIPAGEPPTLNVPNPAAPATLGAGEQQLKPADQQLLPDNLPVLLEPGRPELIPRRKPPARKFQPLVPLTEEEVGSVPEEAGELPLSLEALEPVREPDVAEYNLEDPIARTTLDNIFSNAERFYDGFGGIIRPYDVFTIPRPAFEGRRGLRIGSLHLHPGISGALTGTREKGEGGGNSDETTAVIAGSLSGLLGSPDTGRYLTFDYGMARTFESEQAEDSDLDKSFFLAGHLAFGNLRLGMGISYATLSGFNRDAGSDLQRDYLTMALTSTYQLTPRTSFDWDIATPNGRYPSGDRAGTIGDTGGFTNTNFVRYEYSGKSTVGLGFAAGYLDAQDADTQTFERVLASVNSTPTAFLSYGTTFGLEFRDTGQRRVTHPIFSLSAVWNPRDRTTISLIGEQRVQNSVGTVASNFVSTSIVLSLSQGLGDRVRVSVTGGFENAKYESLGPGESINRLDRTYLVQFSVGTTIFDNVGVSATVSYVRESPSSYRIQGALQASFTF